MKNTFLRNSQKGQTLLETVIAIGIILVGLLGTVTLIISSIKATDVSKQELIAYNLASEGVEVVRNMRDSNWLAIDAGETDIIWDSGLAETGDDFDAIATFENNAWTLNFSVDDFDQVCGAHVCTRLYLGEGIYQQTKQDISEMEATQLYRLITLRPICRDDTGKEGIVNQNGNNCQSLVNSGELNENTKKVGIEVESTVQYRAGNQTVPYTLVSRLYNWKPGVVE